MVVSDFQVFVRDLLQHVNTVQKDYPEIPVFLLGHSMVSSPTEKSSKQAWSPRSHLTSWPSVLHPLPRPLPGNVLFSHKPCLWCPQHVEIELGL